MYRDEQLDKYLTKIKENNDKLVYYKKAIKRLDELKEKYLQFCNLAKKKNKTKANAQNIDDIVQKLDKINNSLVENQDDMATLIENFVKQKALLDKLETTTSQSKNELYLVNKNRNQIEITKLNQDEF